jgi:hypothetical protein
VAAETGIGLLRGAVLISSGTLVSTGASGTVAGKGSQVPAGTTTPPGGTVPSSYRHALSCACGVVGFETSLSYALPERHRGQAQENCISCCFRHLEKVPEDQLDMKSCPKLKQKDHGYSAASAVRLIPLTLPRSSPCCGHFNFSWHLISVSGENPTP